MPDVEVEGRPVPEGEELAAVRSDGFRDILNDFASERDAYEEKDIEALATRLR